MQQHEQNQHPPHREAVGVLTFQTYWAEVLTLPPDALDDI